MQQETQAWGLQNFWAQPLGKSLHKRSVCVCILVDRTTEEVTFISYMSKCVFTVLQYIKTHFEDKNNEMKRKLNNNMMEWYCKRVKEWKQGTCLPLSVSKRSQGKKADS